MALQYPDYSQQRQQQQPQMNPQQALQGFNIAKQFIPALQGGGGGTAAASGAGGSGAASGAGGVGSAMSSAGPWAALAAVIFANEWYASAHGYRPKDKKKWAKQLFTGEVLTEDVQNRWGPKLGIEPDSKLGRLNAAALAPAASPADPGYLWEKIKDAF